MSIKLNMEESDIQRGMIPQEGTVLIFNTYVHVFGAQVGTIIGIKYALRVGELPQICQ